MTEDQNTVTPSKDAVLAAFDEMTKRLLPQYSFRIICDETNNTLEDREARRLNVTVVETETWLISFDVVVPPKVDG